MWTTTATSVDIFNERAARRSRSTSRFGCHVSRIAYRLNNLNNLNNFKVQLRWLPLTESTQIFNERAARRSRSTSRFGCSVSGVPCRVSPEQLEQFFLVSWARKNISWTRTVITWYPGSTKIGMDIKTLLGLYSKCPTTSPSHAVLILLGSQF